MHAVEELTRLANAISNRAGLGGANGDEQEESRGDEGLELHSVGQMKARDSTEVGSRSIRAALVGVCWSLYTRVVEVTLTP